MNQLTQLNFKTMRKVLFLFSLFIAFSANSFSQTLQAGEQTIGLGLGIPSITQNYTTFTTPSLNAFYEYGFTNKVGIGHIGGGAIMSMAGADYDYNDGKYRHFLIGPRASYHFDMADLTGDRAWDVVDVYAGVMSGLRFEQYKWDYTNINGNKVTEKKNDTSLITDVFVGIRYAFAKNVGVYAEAGYGVSYLTLGISFRF